MAESEGQRGKDHTQEGRRGKWEAYKRKEEADLDGAKRDLQCAYEKCPQRKQQGWTYTVERQLS